jgi:hypothetical protein
MTLACDESGNLVSVTILAGGYLAIQWESNSTNDPLVFPYEFCLDGGTLYCRIRSLAADCFDGTIGIGPDGGGGTPVTVSPGGAFVPCP